MNNHHFLDIKIFDVKNEKAPNQNAAQLEWT
jgi:hypothetical protein